MLTLALPQRFTSKVDFDGDNGCWNWTAAVVSNGYGTFRLDGRMQLAHRIAYESQGGQIPVGLFLDHICSNRRCVNPEHLRVVTNKQNQEHRTGAAANSTSGVRGVHWDRKKQRWRVQVKHHGKVVHGRGYASLAEAGAAAVALRAALFTHDDN